jgi:dTDP-4-amino-4,6-dideoxygalactose transaminase
MEYGAAYAVQKETEAAVKARRSPDTLLLVEHPHVLTIGRRAAPSAILATPEHLAARGVASGIHYPVPVHLSEAYAALGLGPGSLPVSERMAHRICSLPMFPQMTAEAVASVASAVAEFAPAEPLAVVA